MLAAQRPLQSRDQTVMCTRRLPNVCSAHLPGIDGKTQRTGFSYKAHASRMLRPSFDALTSSLSRSNANFPRHELPYIDNV